MRRAQAFAIFWRNFIIGDDWTIAITIAWALLAIFTLNQRAAFQTNYLLPVIVVLVLVASIYRELVSKRGVVFQFPDSLQALVRWQFGHLWVPLCLVNVLRYSFSGQMVMAHAVMPLLFNVVIVTIIALCLSVVYVKRPFAASVLAIVFAVLSDRFQVNINLLSQRLENAPAPGLLELALGLATIIIIGFCFYASRLLNSRGAR